MTSASKGLVINAVRKTFGHRTVLADVSLAVPPKCICSLVGPNGAGKSTLLNICLGYILPESGTVLVAGADLHEQPIAARMKIAYVPDVAHLYARLSAVENLLYFESLRGEHPTRARCLGTLERLRFPADSADQPTSTYSKGMRQKVSLAMGVLKEAEVFLLDEPSSGLDAESSDELLMILRNLADHGKAILFSTHHSELVDKVADIVAHLREGSVMCSAPPKSRGERFMGDGCLVD